VTKSVIVEEGLPFVDKFTLNDVFNQQINGSLSSLNIPVVDLIKTDLSYLCLFNMSDGQTYNLPYPVIFDPLDLSIPHI